MKIILAIILFLSLLSCGAKKKISVQTEVVTSGITITKKDSVSNKVETTTQTQNKATQEEIVTEVVEYTQTPEGETVVVKKTTQTHKITTADSTKTENVIEEEVIQEVKQEVKQETIIKEETKKEVKTESFGSHIRWIIAMLLLCLAALYLLKKRGYFK